MAYNPVFVQSVNGSSGTFSLMTASSLSSSRNGNSISFGLASNITTALQSAGAYLTTARGSTDAIGLNTAGTNITATINSSGFSLNAAGYAGTGTTGTNATFTLNSNGLQLNAGAYLTTAAASNHSHGNPTLNLTNLSGTTASNSNGLTLSLSAGNYLTTAMASNRGTDFVQATAAFAGTNASGTIASNGISVSVNAGGGATPVASASNGSFSFTTLGFSNANNVTFGTSAGSIITASVAAPGAAAENNNINLLGANTAGNTTASGSTIGWSGINLTLSGTNGSAVNISAPATSSLSGTGGISFSTNGNTISVGYNAATGSYFDNMLQQNSLQAITYTSVSTAMFGRVILQPLTPANEMFPFNITAETMRLGFSNSGSSNISGAFSSSWYIGVYTRVNSTQLSLLNSVSTSYGLAANVSNSASFLGARWLSFHSSLWSSAPVFSQTRYFFALLARSSSNSYASHSIGGMHLGATNQRSGNMATAASSNTSFNAWHPFMGVHSLTTHTALPASIANSEINKATTYANFIPQVIFDAGLGVIN